MIIYTYSNIGTPYIANEVLNGLYIDFNLLLLF